MSFKVYLAGPIAGLGYDDAQDWRDKMRSDLLPDIHGYSPLRGKQFLRSAGVIGTASYSESLATDGGIMRRDHTDCVTSNLVFANLLGAKKVSRGTDMEFAWAYTHQIPLVVAVESDSDLLNHPMVRAAIDYRVDTLHEAVALIRHILLP